jgi:hypothetical protein
MKNMLLVTKFPAEEEVLLSELVPLLFLMIVLR